MKSDVGAVRQASDLIIDRLFVAIGSTDADAEIADALVGQRAGMVLTGKRDLGMVSRMANAYPNLVICAESDAMARHTATPSEPFLLGGEHLFGGGSLADDLDDQRAAQASVAVTPTGHVAPGDSDSLKAIVEKCNELDRKDVLVHLPVHWTWARPDNARQLAAVIARSRHPVALSLADSADPLNHAKVPEAVRGLARAKQLVLWRTDLAAFDHRSHGGCGAAVGFRPSLRHGTRPGSGGAAIDPRDRTPNILVPQLLRYVRGSFLEDRFANAAPPTCLCTICAGDALDRFSGSDPDRRQAHLHNLQVLLRFHNELRRVGAGSRPTWWRRQLAEAIAAHALYSRQLRTDLQVPSVLASWARLSGIDPVMSEDPE